ncbi:agmatinase [Flavilitoribacter nigricans]|uniref:Agmatinase n=1 Tax=Flavilitoribacter nigricans (strain ATCC 23147 / DSM 23189 / NBRC 102662 / NCIMB 1420 / SS-2) TaxID=1122177 RepID=A0A2D0NGG7_FLAN2|nr:agmatinase [Flavilitoribacter nigricans]PHN07585.1 agmatinase [Flavilitoribacter nigricans DSM 23189 = NBRC 102662]
MSDFQERVKSLLPDSIAIVGVPFDDNSSYLKGAAAGPSAIRAAYHSESTNYYAEDGTNLLEAPVSELGDMPVSEYFDIQQHTETILARGGMMIALGGDHSITYPLIKGHSRYYDWLTILQIDAHGDLYDNFEGNPYSHASPFARIMEEGLAKRLIQVGNRTLTNHQRDQAKRFGVDIIEMKDWRPGKKLPLEGPLYLSVDLDVLDPAFAPGVSHYEPGGMSVRDLIGIISQINVPLIGADIVEYNPSRDLNDMTAMVGARLCKEIIAKILKG